MHLTDQKINGYGIIEDTYYDEIISLSSDSAVLSNTTINRNLSAKLKDI